MKLLSKTLPLAAAFLTLIFSPSHAFAAERFTLTSIVASNEGTDFDLDNDAYRDQILQLFSYKSYKQVDEQVLSLEPGVASEQMIQGGYSLYLKLIGIENHQDRVHVLIKKDNMEYMDTVLTVEKPGVVFLGGPKVAEGDLIIVLEMGF